MNFTLITLLLLFGGGMFFFLRKIFPDGWPMSASSLANDAFVIEFLVGPYLPGVASIVAKMAVVSIGKPATDENPYKDDKDHSPSD